MTHLFKKNIVSPCAYIVFGNDKTVEIQQFHICDVKTDDAMQR